MNSRERVLTTMNHREPDRIPLDFGGIPQSGIHIEGYKKLRDHLSLPKVETRVLSINSQNAKINDDFIDRLKIDTYIDPIKQNSL